MRGGELFARFYAASWPRLYGQVRLASTSAAEAEDSLQEAYSRALVRWDRIAAYDDPEAWVRRVAINELNSAHRRRRRLRALAPRLCVIEGSADPMEGATASADLWTLVKSLPGRQRAAIVLYYVADLSIEQVAEELHKPTGTIKSDLHRARHSLAIQLSAELPTVPIQGGKDE